jgi:hypothetical protein
MEQSLIIAKAALRLSISDREEENKPKKEYRDNKGIKTAAIDFGGEYNKSVKKIIENAVIAARRENLINETHSNQGAVAGATHEALKQIMGSAVGLNIGGKIGIARKEDHLVVAIFFGVGMLNLNEVAVGLSHRTIN